MGKEPWEEKIVKEENSRIRKSLVSTHWLTIIFSLFFTIMLIILFIVFYTSNRGENRVKETSVFVQSSKNTVKTKKSSAVKSSSTSSSSSEAKEKGETIEVLPGEGAGSIAARAGITIEQLEKLNPEHMTLGYWYANPGELVYIN